MAVRNRIVALGGATLIAIIGMLGLGASAASAATAGTCNAYGAVLAGQGMECTVTVDNYVNGLDQYSTVTITECHGAAYTVLLAPACVTTVTVNTELVDTVNQCNGTLNGGGSNVTCSVRVNNFFSGPAIPAIATLNQCIGSGAGGTSPVGTPLNCSPIGATVGATVTQCNGSVNGGGSPLRVTCTLPAGSETALPFTITQCNGTVNGGGSALFCSAEFTNTYNTAVLPAVPAVPSTTTTPATTGGTFGTPGGPTFAPPGAVGGVTVVAAAPPTGTAAVLAMSGSDSTAGVLTAAMLILLGVAATALGARRIRRPAHRLG